MISAAVTFSAAVRMIRPWPSGLTRSRIDRRRLRSESGSRFDIPKPDELGTRTTNRPASDTSWVRRAPFSPMGFLVTWHRIDCLGRSRSSIRGLALSPSALPDSISSGSYWTSPRYSTRVLGRPDVDEGRLHAGQDVLDPAEVDVAVDLADVVGRAGHPELDEAAPLEHRDLGGPLGDVDAHEVPAHGLALAGAAPARPFMLFSSSSTGSS